ncbi:hypothetical protein EMCRGX_G002030 [Ephydatia muelleri]
MKRQVKSVAISEGKHFREVNCCTLLSLCSYPHLFYGRGGLVLAMGAMRVVVAAARVAAGEVVVGALVPILVPVVGLVQVAAVLLLLLLEVGAALLLAVGAALLFNALTSWIVFQ